jgi:uncharacterized protein (DUF952 family)
VPAIYHLAYADDWERARAAGEYRISTRGRMLEDEGFIHCSTGAQVAPVARSYYAGETGLVLLTIDTDRLRAEVRMENPPGAGEAYPHIYGPLNADAVVAAVPFEAPDET